MSLGRPRHYVHFLLKKQNSSNMAMNNAMILLLAPGPLSRRGVFFNFKGPHPDKLVWGM